MAADVHGDHKVNYIAIFWWLLVLTILEVIAGFPATSMQYPQALKGFLLVGMACTKAVLVAMYFMHLRFDKRALSFIAFIPLVLCVYVVLMLMPDF